MPGDLELNREAPSGAEEMLTAIQDREKTYKEEDLAKDLNWLEASGKIYQMNNDGEKFAGNPQELAKYGIDQMSEFNYNVSMGTIPDVMKVEKADHDTQVAFAYMMDTYDKKDITLDGVGRALKETMTDPLTYMGISTLGAGFAANKGAQYAAKEGFKNRLHASIRSYLTSGLAVGATEGALYTSGDATARQSVMQDAGLMNEYDLGNIAVSGAIGAGAGAGIAKGAQVVGRAIGKGIDKIRAMGQDAMGQVAGGGTHSKNYKVYHGTNAKFDKFEAQYPRSAYGNFKGVYFTTDKKEALDYGNIIKEAEVSLDNPLYGNPYEEYAKSKGIDFEQNRFKIKKQDVENWINEKGFDGIIRPSGTQYNIKSDEVIVLDPSKIKEIK